MTNETALDTTVKEPSLTADEAEMLVFALDRPVRFTVAPDWTPNARRILVDLHDEYARHVGHADLFRDARIRAGRAGSRHPRMERTARSTSCSVEYR